MKFNRETLLKSIDDRIAQLKSGAEKAFVEETEEYERLKKEWLESDHPTYFLRAADELIKKARSGLIRREDLTPFEVGYRGEAREEVFRHDRPTYREPNVKNLVSLRDFLRSVTDEEVSSSGLRDVGFRNIAHLMQYGRP